VAVLMKGQREGGVGDERKAALLDAWHASLKHEHRQQSGRSSMHWHFVLDALTFGIPTTPRI
jgi:hypothetical protein